MEIEHNHLTDRITFNKMILKNNLNEEIDSLPNKFLGNAKDIYNKALSKSQSNLNISFDSVKDSIYKKLNADVPCIQISVEDIPNNFESFITVENKIIYCLKINF